MAGGSAWRGAATASAARRDPLIPIVLAAPDRLRGHVPSPVDEAARGGDRLRAGDRQRVVRRRVSRRSRRAARDAALASLRRPGADPPRPARDRRARRAAADAAAQRRRLVGRFGAGARAVDRLLGRDARPRRRRRRPATTARGATSAPGFSRPSRPMATARSSAGASSSTPMPPSRCSSSPHRTASRSRPPKGRSRCAPWPTGGQGRAMSGISVPSSRVRCRRRTDDPPERQAVTSAARRR